MSTWLEAPIRVRPWVNYTLAEQAGILLNLSHQESLKGADLNTGLARRHFVAMKAQARAVSEQVQGTLPPGSLRLPWRWAALRDTQQSSMVLQIARWSLREWTSRRDRPPEVRQQFRELSLAAYSAWDRLRGQQRELAR